MSVFREASTLFLQGECGLEDADSLVQHLSAGVYTVDLARCTSLHASVLQAVLSFAPPVTGLRTDLPWQVLLGGSLALIQASDKPARAD